MQHQEEHGKAELPDIYRNPWKAFNSNPVKPFSGSLGSSNDFPTVHCCMEDMANPLSDRNSRSVKQSLPFPFNSHKVVPKQVTKSWVKLKEVEIITQGRADGTSQSEWVTAPLIPPSGPPPTCPANKPWAKLLPTPKALLPTKLPSSISQSCTNTVCN